MFCQLAEKNKQFKFLLIGQGEYFNHNNKPENLTWINNILEHEKLLRYINGSKCALMLTRRDTQGVMSCKLETYGIPLITSDLEVCREVFSVFENIEYVSNNVKMIDLRRTLSRIDSQKSKKNVQYYASNTISKELQIIDY